MPVDLGVFERQKSIVDQQQLQDAFELKKALAIQAAQKNALETQALQTTALNGGISLKDLMGFQIAQQNHQDTVANQQATREDTKAYRDATLGLQSDKINDKKDLKMRNDQNLLAGALDANQQQINKINDMFLPDGVTLKPDVAANYGTVMGYQLPVTFQSTADARAKLGNINANSFINALGAMKSQSATGASGLGALSEKEGDKVQAASNAAADTKQSAASAAANFLAYKKTLADTNARLQTGFQNIYGQGGAPVAAPAPGKLIGTSGGRNVYELPDGSHVMEQ